MLRLLHRVFQSGGGVCHDNRELVTTDETGCSKQDFAIYERALDILGSSREATWAVDDAPYALAVMHDFGLNTIAVGPRHATVAATVNTPTLESLL